MEKSHLSFAETSRFSSARSYSALGFLLAFSLAGTLTLGGCTGQSTAESAPTKTEAPPPEGVHRFLPLKDRTVSTFATLSDLGEEGMLNLEFFRPRAALAEIRIAGNVQRLRIEENRIAHATGGVLLEEPIEKNRSFQGSFGKVTIQKVDQTIKVPAGTFFGCIVTVEESKMPPKRLESTFCPDVGLTRMVVETFGGDSQRLETTLKHFGPRVDLTQPSSL